MQEDLLTTNQIINSNKESELIVPLYNTLKYKFFISSNTRDKHKFPLASKFSADLPFEITNICNINLLDINIKKKTSVFKKNNIFEWEYPNKNIQIPIEQINTIEKINNYFNLNKVLYGYTKAFDTNECSILFTFKSNNIIQISLFGNDKAETYDLFKIIKVKNPCIKLSFMSITGDLKYDYILKSISEININDSKMKKVYNLNVISEKIYMQPFSNYFNNKGNILMCIYHSIVDDISSNIPLKYHNKENKLFLMDYHKILTNSNINNDYVFGKRCIIPEFTIKKQDIKVENLLNIDPPKNNQFRILLNDVTSFKECKKKLEKEIIYNDCKYIWKFTYSDQIVLEHFKILNYKLIKLNNRIYIDKGANLNKDDILCIKNRYYSVRIDDNNKPYFYTNNDNVFKDPIYLLTECILTKNSRKFLDSLQISYQKKDSSWNNFTISEKNPINKIFVYGINNSIVVETNSIDNLNIGDKVVIRDAEIENKGILKDNIPKFIFNICKKKTKYLITIYLEGFFIGNNKIPEFYEYGNGGYLSKVINPNSIHDENIYLNLANCNYINVLNNPKIIKTFAIINKDNNISGGKFTTKKLLKSLFKLNINLLKDDNTYIDIENVSIVLEVIKEKKPSN